MIEAVLEQQHVVHVGYHKAASTWLHRDVFPVASHHHSVCGDYADSNRTTQAFVVEQDLASLGDPLRGSTQESV